ncbi:hypothetical protein BD324DRAFT_621014 [Kockovaella imperatae]|uniref:Uncharacterized protein n=1 Tax=Kockovaella imperatae TaxID=4999 RepID=A0A1Y1UKA7_9TREE|nr:hypothetical protein BD324DRAFT_621014 [Kockovaella imperatae]ORX38481.1 hypothetical protein BD324DRAFT_621014 [Kockovaella imperatae]
MDFYWSPSDSIDIGTFLQKHKPSLFTTDETPWIWVRGVDGAKEDPERDDKHADALLRAKKILGWLEKRLMEIDHDDGIPLRAKKGTMSKKQVRDEAHDTAKSDLKVISIDSGWTAGKWMLFPRHADVDRTWGVIATSVANGPLRDAGVKLAKVAPSRSGDEQNSTHVICVYVDDVYHLGSVRKILEALLRHGIEPSAVKSDLYTLAGIDSNHSTKLRSSIWRPNEVMNGGAAEVKKLVESSRTTTKVGPDGFIDSDSEDGKIETKGKKRVHEGKGEEARGQSPHAAPVKKVKKDKSAAVKYVENDIFGGGSDTE